VAHGVILTSLYLPVALMLVGLILRGVSFDFRIKVRSAHKTRWNRLFAAGSALAALSQGYMLGLYIVGFERSLAAFGFGVLIAACLAAGYVLLGATWLIVKTEGSLQLRAVTWARRALWVTAAGIGAVSIVTPLVSQRIFDKWFALPEFVLLLPVPIATLTLLWVISRSLQRLPVRLAQGNEYGVRVPFGCAIGLYALAFYGLAYSLFPYLVVDRLDIWQAASAPESLLIIFWGAVVVLPVIVLYSVFAYRIFGGKARALDYG
jgi:cytochrome d ubiquinol oxidase subunit II